MEVVVLADTHLKRGIDVLHPRVLRALQKADFILHAGDFVSPRILYDLREITNVHGVLGNNDGELTGMLPEAIVLDLDGVDVAMVHNSGSSAGREARLARRFPRAQVVVFGHSHIPVNKVGIRGQLLFNPGSPTQRRSQPARSFGRLRFENGRIRRSKIEALD